MYETRLQGIDLVPLLGGQLVFALAKQKGDLERTDRSK